MINYDLQFMISRFILAIWSNNINYINSFNNNEIICLVLSLVYSLPLPEKRLAC